jgi:hypothetical protein
MADMSILAFCEHLARATFALAHEEHEAMTRACEVVEKEAKAEIGNYQKAAGPFPKWDFLSDATLYGFWHELGFWVPGKFAQGYGKNMPNSSVDDPLERTGKLRDSIHHKVEGKFGGSEGAVGSDDPVAEYQELGTPNARYPIPPRSFLGRAAFVKAHEAAHILGQAPVIALCGASIARKIIPIP